MDPRLLRYYSRELQHVRDMGGEFAREYPKIAGRLGLDAIECADPYVERLLEGFAFLAARVQLKIDAEFPRFTQHLLELVYPHYLAPTPSMAVVQMKPDPMEGNLARGLTVPRGTVLRSILGKGDRTACEYRTAHDVALWPLELVEAKYFTYSDELAGFALAGRVQGVKAAIRLRLRATAGLNMNEIALDRLSVHVCGSDEQPMQIHERLLANAVGVAVLPARRPASWHLLLPKSSLRMPGFDDTEALLPYGPRSFQGYRLLHEYFAMPQRYLFVELCGLAAGLQRCETNEIDVVVLLDRSDIALEQTVCASNFALFCTPAINLFPKRTDRIHLSHQQFEYHVVPDRTRPLDFEVYQVQSVTGYGSGSESEQAFLPFYSSNDLVSGHERRAYYQVRRAQRALSAEARERGTRTSYVGSEAYVSLVDAEEAPYRGDLRQLGLQTLCTNRDLPLSMSVGLSETDFTIESGAPVQSVRCLVGPTRPTPSYAQGDPAWRLVSHLSLNYLSLLDRDEHEGAEALRELLSLYSGLGDAGVRKQIDGVRSVSVEPVVRRLPGAGPICYGRGLNIKLALDEAAFEGTGVFLLGAVLEQFFARYVSINSFTETVLRTPGRGEIMRWPARTGRRPTL